MDAMQEAGRIIGARRLVDKVRAAVTGELSRRSDRFNTKILPTLDARPTPTEIWKKLPPVVRVTAVAAEGALLAVGVSGCGPLFGGENSVNADSCFTVNQQPVLGPDGQTVVGTTQAPPLDVCEVQ